MDVKAVNRLGKLHQAQNDAKRQAEVFRALQIKRERNCTWGEALMVNYSGLAQNIVRKENPDG
jgi:hypothetical protein